MPCNCGCGCEDCNGSNTQQINQDGCNSIGLAALDSISNLHLDDLLYVFDISARKSTKMTVRDFIDKISFEVQRVAPTFYNYVNLSELVITYTPELKEKYGQLPTITIFDTAYNVVAIGSIGFDSLTNPTAITITTGSPETLIIKMS